MPFTIETLYFGPQTISEELLLEFPAGLPAFEDCRRFAALNPAELRPLVFLQSLDRREVCFLALPVFAAQPDFTLEAHPDDLASIGFGCDEHPQPPHDVLCLALVSLREEGPTANLRAPVVVNLRNRRAVQAIDPGGRFSHRQPLLAEALAA